MKKYFILLLLALFPIWVCAQNLLSETTTSKQVAEVHMVASFVKSLDHGLSLTFEEEIRSSHISLTTIGLGYTPLSYLSMGGSYVLKFYGTQGWVNPHTYLRHRANIYLIGQIPLGQWKLSLRELLMMDGRADEIDKREKNALDLTLRTRLQASYSIPNQPISIVGKVELFNTLNAPVDYINQLDNVTTPYGQYINELRPEIGVQWKINKQNSVNIAYRYNYVYKRDIDILTNGDVNIANNYSHKHILHLTYKFGW